MSTYSYVNAGVEMVAMVQAGLISKEDLEMHYNLLVTIDVLGE